MNICVYTICIDIVAAASRDLCFLLLDFNLWHGGRPVDRIYFIDHYSNNCNCVCVCVCLFVFTLFLKVCKYHESTIIFNSLSVDGSNYVIRSVKH